MVTDFFVENKIKLIFKQNKFDGVDSSVVEHPAFNRLVEGSKPSQPILKTVYSQVQVKKKQIKKFYLGNC